jgi:nucleoside-diphosphate-sugar epimerase
VNVYPTFKDFHTFKDFQWSSRGKGTILVTGGMGNIGKNVVRKLLGSGYRVLCLDVQDRNADLITLLQEDNMRTNVLNGPTFHFHRGDIRDVNATVGLLFEKGVVLEGIIHLAAVSRVAFCLDNEVDCRDVNTRGTELLLQSVKRYSIERSLRETIRHTRYTKPWMIFASSREVYGSKCDVDSPCNEESLTDPLNLYGVTKWEGEESIRRHGDEVLSDYIILRLASVYGGIFDLPERLIPSLAIKSMTKETIDLNGGNQIFDFVHVDDVVGSILLAVERLEKSTPQGGQTNPPQDGRSKRDKEKFLICSGQHITAFQVLQYLQHLVQSSSPLRLAPSDNRYPSNFVCNNSKMQTDLGNDRLVHQDLYQGLAHYVEAIYKHNLGVLEQKYTSYCSEMMMARRFDSRTMQNCSIYMTAVVEGPDYLKHLSYPEPTRKRHIGNGVVLRGCPKQAWILQEHCFLLEYENGTGTGSPQNDYVAFDGEPIYFYADFDMKTGGYILRGHIPQITKKEIVLGHGFKMVFEDPERQLPTSSLPVSIWPYSCPPDPVTGNARLPTAPYDPVLYLLHEIVPPEPKLPSARDQPLFCRRIEAAIDFTRQRIGRIHTLSAKGQKLGDTKNTASVLTKSVPPATVCDSDCELLGGCVDTGECRCVNPFCGRDLDPSASFPFSAWAFTNVTSYAGHLPKQTESVREQIATLPYSTVLKGPVATMFHNWVPPKIHLMDVNFTHLAGKALDNEATTITQIPYGSCFVADHFHRIGLQGLNTSLDEADFIFVPFYGGWLRHYARREDPDIAGILNGLLKQAHDLRTSAAVRVHGESLGHIVIPLTHDYGAALNFSYDMRDFRGESLPQQPLLQSVTVLSPFGDFNTLAYLPEKDIVIPPASCKTPLLLETFKNVSFVRRASDREFLLYFGGSADHRTGSAIRNAFLAGNLFPRSNIEISTAQDNNKYMQQLNDSIFCPHIFGTTGWATRLSDTIYAGCIPILTSDVTHPPYWDILDWAKFSVYVDWRHLEEIEDILQSFSFVELERKQAWLLKVRDAFIYDPGEVEQESHGMGRKGPIFHTLLSLKIGALRQKQKSTLRKT